MNRPRLAVVVPALFLLELAIARTQGHHVADIARRLKRGSS